jgi:hypothetical protein
MIITASAVATYAPKITASAATITAGNYISVVQERICLLTNNYFTSDTIMVQDSADFSATDNTIILDGNKWEEFGFKANDDILVYRSLRNDSVKTISTISDYTATLASSCTVIDESYSTSDGPAIIFSLVQWPVSVVQTAAKMIWYDVDYRDKNPSGLRSRSLGPLSESFGSSDTDDAYGYPKKLVDDLSLFRIARLS